MNESYSEPQGMHESPVSAMSKDERTWGMLCHASALAGYLIPGIGNIVAPLVVWLIKKDEYPFVDDQGKESLNFQISLTIYTVVSLFLCALLIGFVLLPIVGIFAIVMMIVATVRANDGVWFRYPFTIRFLS